MSDVVPVEPRKAKGTSFPSLPLRESVDAVVIAGQNGADHHQEAFATYLNHRTANSGAFRAKLASLRDWGLITKRGEKDRVALTGLAQNLVMASPDHYDEADLILQAFDSCRVFSQLYDDSAKNVATDLSRLRNQVLMRLGVSSDQVDKFVECFAASADFAGLAELDGPKITLLARDAVNRAREPEEADDAEESELAPSNWTRVLPTPTEQPMPVALSPEPATPIALRQAWPIDGGEIEFVIRTSEALPPSIYALVAEMAEVAEKMKVKLTGPAVEITTNNPPAAYRASEPTGD